MRLWLTLWRDHRRRGLGLWSSCCKTLAGWRAINAATSDMAAGILKIAARAELIDRTNGGNVAGRLLDQ